MPQVHFTLANFKAISLATVNGNVVKPGGGRIHNISAWNTAATARFVKLYDKATAPAVGTDVPIATYMVAAGSGFVADVENGLKFANGIALAITTGLADNDTGSTGANEVVVNLAYL